MSREALDHILGPLRKSQRTIIILIVEAMAAMRQAACISIALALAQRVGCQADCALTHVYRLLHNPRLDDQIISREMIRTLSRRTHIPRSQNCWENTFLEMLTMTLREAGAAACFLADRGFRRTSFIKLLLQQSGHTFVVRLAENVKVRSSRGTKTLRKWDLQPGRALDLGYVDLRQDAAVRIRVVGIWARGHREPWWLATNRDDSLGHLVALYDRRMAIEEQIRDVKGARFGFALVWTQIKTPESLARFALLIGLSVLFLTAVGYALSQDDPKIRLPCKKKGPRLSLLNIGLLLWPIIQSQITITPRFLDQNLPPPTLRSFPWLNRYDKSSK